MAKVTLETLEKSFKETMTNTLKGLVTYSIKNDTDVPPDNMKEKLETYIDEMINAVEECGGGTDDVLKWTQEILGNINVVDLVEEAIEDVESD